jgi:aspartyl protease family protein
VTGGNGMNALFLALLLILPLSSLIARRIPLGRTIKMAAAWVAIFAAAMILISGRHQVGAVWARVTTATGGSDQSVVGGSVRIEKADDGHFWATARINGVKRRMLIDSGATDTAISSATAAAARLDLDQSPFAEILSTANGSVAARRSTIATLKVGSITASDLPVVVSPAFGDTDVLGMNFLSRLKGWQVEGDTLILQPQPASISN